jgi:hypothetical protein
MINGSRAAAQYSAWMLPGFAHNPVLAQIALDVYFARHSAISFPSFRNALPKLEEPAAKQNVPDLQKHN